MAVSAVKTKALTSDIHRSECNIFHFLTKLNFLMNKFDKQINFKATNCYKYLAYSKGVL